VRQESEFTVAATLKPYVGFQDDLFPGNVSRGWLRDFHLPPHEDTFVYWAWGEEGEVGKGHHCKRRGEVRGPHPSHRRTPIKMQIFSSRSSRAL